MKRKSGFTLIELLIVIVILGILSTAILPKFTGYLAKTRDLQRKLDLEHVAIAIERYKTDTGKLPTRVLTSEEIQKLVQVGKERNYNTLHMIKIQLPNYGYVSALSTALGSYLTLPTDPQKNNQIRLHVDFYWHQNNPDIHRYQLADMAAKPGEYLYQIMPKSDKIGLSAVLIAKAETPELANYILIDKTNVHPRGGAFQHPEAIFATQDRRNLWDIGNLKLCNSLEKVKKGNESFQLKTDGKVVCKFSNTEQLYYILKIE